MTKIMQEITEQIARELTNADDELKKNIIKLVKQACIRYAEGIVPKKGLGDRPVPQEYRSDNPVKEAYRDMSRKWFYEGVDSTIDTIAAMLQEDTPPPIS